jgi:hypothetical protein
MRDIHTTVREYQFEITVADSEYRVRADHPEDHIGGELQFPEEQIQPHRGCRGCLAAPSFLPARDASAPS